LAGLLGTCVAAQTPVHYSLLDNLNEKLSHEELADTVILGTPHKKYVPIVAGADELLNYVDSAPQFKKDPLWGRLAHTHPLSTVAYREEDNPSTHVVFLKLPDGSLKADIHLDGNGPQQVFPHLDEFFFHKLTLQDNDQDLMHANLEREFAREAKAAQPAFITNRERTLQYVHDTFGLQPTLTAVGNGMFRHYLHGLVWKDEPHYVPMVNRVEGELFRNAVRHTVEYGMATWLQEDSHYRASGHPGTGRRLRAAFVNTFVVPTPTGREFAYARFASIVATAGISDAWHPWRDSSYRPNYFRQATFGLMVDPLARSMWAEFGPDLLRSFRREK
jgi:hypothetical protein